MLNNKFILLLLTGFVILVTCRKIEREMMVLTGSVSEITFNSAKMTGEILDLGEKPTQYGHYYSTISNERKSGSWTRSGVPSKTGAFTSDLTGLTPETKYYVRAYITNGHDTVYDNTEINFTTLTNIQAPAFRSAVIENATPSLLAITYSLTLANIVPAASAFTVMVSSAARSVAVVAVSGDKILLTLAGTVNSGEVVTVAYTKPGTNPVQTPSGIQAATMTAQDVTNNVAPVPVYVSSAIENTTPSLLEMTYSLTLANVVPAASAFTVMVNSSARPVAAVSLAGAKVQLTLSSPVNSGDIVTVAYTKPATGPIQTLSGAQAATITAQNVTNNITPVPAYVSSVIENATPSLLEITYNLSLANILPATSAFTVMVNSSARTVTTVAVSGAKVQLTLASSVISSDVVTVAYTKPATNPVQTPTGGQAATMTAQNVINKVTPVPAYVSSVIENATPSLLEITYSLTLANVVPAASAFTVRVNSTTRTVTTVAISGAKVQLTLAGAVNSGDVVTVAYTKPGTNPVQTPSGGQAATMTAQNVTNNVGTTPVYVSSAIENATPSLLEITYSLPLANVIPATSAFTVMVNSSARSVTSVAISGAKVQLTLASAVNGGDVVTVAYTRPGTNPVQTPSGVQAATITAQSVTNNVASTPAYVSSSVENATPSLLEITYSLTLANVVPATSAFTVLVNSSARSVAAVSVSGAKVQLILSGAINAGDVVTVAYTKPVTNPVQTSAGGQAATMAAQNVTNNVAAAPVYLSSVIENATPSLLEITYNLSLANVIPASSAFTVLVNSAARTVTGVSVSGAKVRLTLAAAVVYGDIVSVSYVKPATNPVQTASGGQASSFTDQSVVNNCITVPSVTTSTVNSITASSALGGGNVTSTGGSPVISRGVCWATTTGPVVSGSHTTNGTGTGSFTSTITGLTVNTTYHLRAYATNGVGTGYGNEVTFTTYAITDADGNNYTSVVIGTQVWMVENLKTTKYNDNSPISLVTDNTGWSSGNPAYCWYGNNTANKNLYGALYNWYAINTGMLCPAGWHVSTDADLTTLTTYLGGLSVAGGKMKETGTTHWTTPNTDATNTSGFTGLPGGYRYNTGTFYAFGFSGHFWSSTSVNSTDAWHRALSYDYGSVDVLIDSKQYGFSVRCVKD